MRKFCSILLAFIIIFGTFEATNVFADNAEPEAEEIKITDEEPASDSVAIVEEKINEIGDVTIYSGKKIKEARVAYDELTDEQKALVGNLEILTDAEGVIADLYTEAADTDPWSIYEATGQYIEGLGTPDVGSVGGEWMVIDLTRSGRACPEGYYENVVDYVNENINDKEQLHRAKSTDNSRVILALTSAGYDVTDVGGYNLLQGLSDMSYLKKQGINGPIWALIALDSYDYEIPQNENEETQATREAIIAYILEKQLSDGGWSIYGKVSDPDMTGMAIQALAPYCYENTEVRIAVETALDCLSAMQHENGSFGSIDGVCAESCAQVIVALTALEIDPEADERFLKNGISAVDALCNFAVDGVGFEHIPYGGLNGMATEQGQYALASYFRLVEGLTPLYDMTDVIIEAEKDEAFESSDAEANEDFAGGGEAEDSYILDDGNEAEDSYILDGGDDIMDADCESDMPVTDKPAEEELEAEEVEEFEKPTFTNDTFADVKAEDWYFESVKYVYENNIMQGADGKFEPESRVTRGMMTTVLYRLSGNENIKYTHIFADVPSGEWYSDAVAWAAENNIVKGVSEDKFAPEEYVTREQMALIIYRYAKSQGIDARVVSEPENHFTDITDVSDWAFDAVLWANSVELIKGTGDLSLSPKGTATRAEIAAILMRFCKMTAK